MMEGNINEDMWTPFKELLSVVEGAVSKPVDAVLEQLEKFLQKHKQNFFTLLKNPPKNVKSREDLQKGITEGISLPGIGHQTLPQELVDEALIISDMYDLNEYMALDLLCTAHHQMPYHPGLTRGLVAVLLYYDGKKSLVTALRVLIQARQGMLWTVDCHQDVSNYITNYTDELLASGLISKILNVLESLDLSKEIELLQKNRALGGPRHHHQIVDLYQGIRQTLADVVYLLAAQNGLPKQPTLELIGLLRRMKCQEDAIGGIDNVVLALQMALLYAIDVSVLHKRQDGEELIEKLPLLEQTGFVNSLLSELSSNSNSRPWEYPGIQALTQFAWGVSLATLRMAPPSLQPQGLVDEDDVLVDTAVDGKVFNFLHTSFLLNETIFKEEFYLRRIHCLLTDFIALMPLKVKELRNRADEAAKTVQVYAQEGLDPPANLPHNFEDLLLTLATLYGKDPLNLNLELEFWCPPEGLPSSFPYRTPPRQVPLFKFVRQSGDLLPQTLFVPYMKMLSSLSSCQQAARQCFNLLKLNTFNAVTWDHFFNSFARYYSNLRQELPPTTDTVYRHRSYPKGITAQEIQALLAVLNVIKTVAEYDDVSRLALCENPTWAPLTVLLGLVSCCIQIPLKAELLLTLAALAKSPDTAATLWHNLEASQILVTVPSTSSYQPRGIQTELEELESRNEEFPLTRAMLRLLDVLTDVPVPRLLGVGNRMPGFDPYLTFIIQSVLLRFNNRSYKNPQEKWEVCQSCLQLLVKLLSQYEPQGEDFVGGMVQIQGGSTSQVNPPPGYHIMVNLCSKSELLRRVLHIIDEGCILLDTYSLFPGKSQLEASTLSCLQLLDTALSLQQKFLMILSNVNCSMLLTPLNKLLLGVNPRSGKPDHLLSIAKYVTYNSWLPSHGLLSVRLLLAVTSYPTPQSHIVSIFTSTPQLKTHIRHGFVECLEADPDEVTADGLEEEDVGVVGRSKETICKLLLQCLNQSSPNLAHYLLGFELNKDVKNTIFQQPGVLGFPRTCLHSILTLLSSSLQARHNPTCQPPHPKLVELCYRVIYSLTANVRTSEPTLRFLRSGEFLQKHLAALPFKTDNRGSDLNQMSWLLKTVAIELKVTAAHQQLSQFTSLINLLVSISSDEAAGESDVPTTAPVLASQLTSAFSTSTNVSTSPFNQQLILRLLREFDFFVEPVQQPTWEFFNSMQISQVIKQCETSVGSGLKLIDIKVLHKILMEELAAIQGSSTASQRQLIMKEIQLILKYVLKQNQQRNMASSTTHFLDAWRQVTEVMFAVALSDSLPFESRFCLLLEVLHELLNKVLSNNVIAEMANLSSGAVLLLFVDLRNCFTTEQSKVASGGVESINRLNALVHSRENVLKNIMACIIKWILSSGVASQKIRANLYASLLNFLHLTRQQSPIVSQTPESEQSMLSTFYEQKDVTDEEGNLLLGSRNASLEVLSGFGERLVTVICHDCSGGHDVCKMLALSCLDMMIELDPHGTWISFLSARGYLKFLIDSLLESDNQLCELLSPMLKTLRPLYVYESKMALLCRVASTTVGSELLLEQNALTCLSAMQVFDTHPDITASVSQRKAKLSELDFIPSISSRYLQILSPALSLCETVLSSLGVENESAVVQIVHFLLSHGDTVSMVLRSGSPFLPFCYLTELAQLTGVIARATNQSVRKKIADQCVDATAMLETTSHFHRIQKHMLTLLGQFVVSDSVLKEITNSADVERSKPQEKGKMVNCFLQIAANLVLYTRNLVVSTGVDRRVTSVILQPTLLDPLVAERREVGLGGEASLGIIVQQLVQCVKHYHIEKDSLDFLSQHLNSVSDMNTTNVREFLPEELSSYSALDECRQQAGQVLRSCVADKIQELQLYTFMIEHCLYLLWSHLDYYMLRAIPNKTLGLDKSTKTKGKTTQMGDIAWGVSVDEINQLKQGLISILNDSFCKNLINTTQEQTSTEKGFIEALLRRIKKLIQFVPVK